MIIGIRQAHGLAAAGMLCCFAQTGAVAADTQLEEIIVTAQQRSQSLQDVPVSVTAISGDFVAEHHLKDFSDLALFTPGFVSAPNYGFIRNSSIRGISNNQFGFADDPSIAMYVDGVYQGRSTGMQVNALYDIAQVEIVKGPQATLFGRSSIAGAISTHTNQPTSKFEASADLGFGERARVVAQGMVNLPATPDLAIRLAGDIERQDGYIKNLNGGPDLQPQDIRAARINVKYTGIDALVASLKMDYERRKQGGNVYQAVGLPNFSANNTLIGHQSYSNFDIFDTVGTLKFALSPTLALTSYTSWRRVKNEYAEDYDAVATVVGGPYTQHSTDEMFQQDLLLNYEGSNGVSVAAGASYFHETLDAGVQNWVDANGSFTGFAFTGVPTPGLLPNDFTNAFADMGNMSGTFKGHSVFVDAAVPLTQRIKFEAGARYNSDTKDFTQDIPDPSVAAVNEGKYFAGAYYDWGYWTSTPVSSSHTWNDTSLRAALNWDISDDLTGYLSWSQGWKAGGIDSFTVRFPNDVMPPGFFFYYGMDAAVHGAKPSVYNPEKSDSYEIGLKGKALDQRFRYSVALYDFQYKDLQTSISRGGGSVIENVGKAEGRGAEFELHLLAGTGWDLFANGAYNYTKITEFDERPNQVGLPLNRAPKYMAAGGVSYTAGAPGSVGGDMVYSVSGNYRSKFRTDNGLVEAVDGYVLTNLRVTYQSPGGKYAASLFADNVFDEFNYNRYIQATPFLSPVSSRSNLGYPRTIGIDFHASW